MNTPILQWLCVAIGLIPVALVCLYYGFVGYVYLGLFVEGKRLWRELYEKGRTLELREAKRRVSAQGGTIIVEAPTQGWPVWRIWFTPSDDYEIASEDKSKHDLCHPVEIRNYERFLGPSGTATLVRPFLLGAPNRFLRKHFGKDDCIFIRSATVRLKQLIDEYEDEE